ncbi:hypothetical protein ACFL5G_04815 [Candidatus Margulisiibacteriota bacterium]
MYKKIVNIPELYIERFKRSPEVCALELANRAIGKNAQILMGIEKKNPRMFKRILLEITNIDVDRGIELMSLVDMLSGRILENNEIPEYRLR